MEAKMREEMIFGDRLKQFRTVKGLSQEDFAKELGTTKQVISRYETHQRIPKVTVAQEYARKLKMPISWFFSEEKNLSSRVAETPAVPYKVNDPALKKLLEEAKDLSKEELKSLTALIKAMKTKKGG